MLLPVPNTIYVHATRLLQQLLNTVSGYQSSVTVIHIELQKLMQDASQALQGVRKPDPERQFTSIVISYLAVGCGVD